MAKLQILEIDCSDHLPIFLSLGVQLQRYVRKGFWFENSWVQEVDCKSIVAEGWKQNENIKLQVRIVQCVEPIKKWARSHHEDFQRQLKEVKQHLSFLHKQWYVPLADIKKVEVRNSNLLLQNESYWKQGDSNSSYFHIYASNRFRKNYVNQLKNDDAQWVSLDSGLPDLIMDFYKKLFTSSQGDMGGILSFVQTKIANKNYKGS